jgi:hypothetical protein
VGNSNGSFAKTRRASSLLSSLCDENRARLAHRVIRFPSLMLHHVLVCIRSKLFLYLLVLLSRHSWKFFNEGNDAPNFVVVMGFTE